jgi:2-(1,2-epoxy-1,2-dihydrophenyl)acetyl-CoA isomerase
MDDQTLLVDRHDYVAVVTLNRPAKLNAMDASLRDGIPALADKLRADDEVRAVVITGAGKGFCSGVDLTGGRPDRSELSQNQRLDDLAWVGRLALGVYGLDKPTVAVVNGVSAGAGMSLALACDLRVGGPNARFKVIFLERSLSAEAGMSYLLPRIIGYSRAADLLFTSREVGADEAYRMGLLDRLVNEGEDVVECGVELARQMAAMPPLALRSAKRALQHNLDADFNEALRYEAVTSGWARRAPNDAQEAIASFRERRPPTFTGT